MRGTAACGHRSCTIGVERKKTPALRNCSTEQVTGVSVLSAGISTVPVWRWGITLNAPRSSESAGWLLGIVEEREEDFMMRSFDMPYELQYIGVSAPLSGYGNCWAYSKRKLIGRLKIALNDRWS
jgi:hypothetical protein